jgi:FtsP/CotA-like multicopper oxidase with cupredoxin domain
MTKILSSAFLLFVLALLMPGQALAADGGVCPREETGAVVTPPPDLYAKDGKLKVKFNYYTSVSNAGLTLFCFVTDAGQESPTLHVNPGDRIVMTVTNMVPPVPGSGQITTSTDNVCGDATMTDTSVNVHFHGTNVAPTCHSDEVIRTLINSGETFTYVIHIPKNEPPGLYWYHPHIHGISSAAVTGGACGAIIVEGIENIQPAVAGLPQRVIVLRDQALVDGPGASYSPNQPVPFWDLSINYVPIVFPVEKAAVLKMQAGQKEFWRVVNATANSILDIQLKYDGVKQPLQVVAFDGVPTGSHDGRHQGTIITENDILLPPAGRAEFIVTAPDASVKTAQFSTEAIDTGPLGDSLPFRPLANIALTKEPLDLPLMPKPGRSIAGDRFDGLEKLKATATRHLYFSETFGHATNDGKSNRGGARVNFFITVKGQKPVLYDPNNPPAIITNKGAVEDWIIENHAPEVHEFHMHQIHFLLMAVNGVPVPPPQRQFYDTYQVGYWDQIGPYPKIKVRMDFRGQVVGDFVYHCHILQHEDGGMMAIIRVLPEEKKTRSRI